MAIYDLPGKTILTHNRLGVRIELNFDREGLLELWISPRATSSNASRDRNWSNRDDHTRLFDAIGLRGLSRDNFVRCDYDPFHCVVHFTNQTLHLLSLFDESGVALWFEQAQSVDFKSDKADTPVARESHLFAVAHPDRGLDFHFAAATQLSPTSGNDFIHQITLDAGRSTYATAQLAARQTLAIIGGLSEDRVLERAQNVAARGADELLQHNEAQVKAALQSGAITLRDDDQLQTLIDINRRVLLAQQDAQGAIRAALNRIYYLIWTRDGAIIECFKAYAGWSEGVEKWTRFLLANPLKIVDEEPQGRTYGMLVNPISKWEEDGVFFAIWSAFTTWTQNATQFSDDDLAVLRDAMDWLERYCFDVERGLFGRYFRCEEPLAGSRDAGFDNAVGKATGGGEVIYEGHAIRRSYDIYVNSICHASYMMLGALHDAHNADNEYSNSYENKARNLAQQMEPWFETTPPSYGDLLTDKGEIVRSAPFGLDRCDYVWALTVPPFCAQPHRMAASRRALLDEARSNPRGYFLAAYFSLLSSLDPDQNDESQTRDAIQYAATQCYRAGEFLAMPNTVVELLDMKDGDLYHDVRPQAFSVGPLLATMSGLGLRRLPFGLAVRANQTVSQIAHYEFGASQIDVRFIGSGEISAVRLNDQLLQNTLQLPQSLLLGGHNALEVEMSAVETSSAADNSHASDSAASEDAPNEKASPLWLESSARLLQVSRDENAVVYRFQTLVRDNYIAFRALPNCDYALADESRQSIEYSCVESEGRSWIYFNGKGDFMLRAS